MQVKSSRMRNPGIKPLFEHHMAFLIIAGAGLIATFISMLIAGDGHLWDTFIFQQGKDRFMDFLNHIKYCSNPSQVYYVSEYASFPPLAYCFYFIISLLIPSNSITQWDASKTDTYAYLIYIIYTVLSFVILCAAINLWLRRYSKKYTIVFSCILILSYPFVSGVLERGNSVLIVLVLLILSLYFKDSESSCKRELALIMIAVAAGFKIYPAIFGFLYLREKRYKETLRLIIYGVVIFFLPFVFFGGIDGLIQFVNIQIGTQVHEASVFSVPSLIDRVSAFVLGTTTIQTIVSKLMYSFLLVLMIVMFCIAKLNYQRIGLLTSIIVLFPNWSGNYTMVFFLIPLLVFFVEEEKFTVSSCIIEISLSMVFTLFAVSDKALFGSLLGVSDLYIAEILPIFGSYLFTLMTIVSVILGIKKNQQSRSESNA